MYWEGNHPKKTETVETTQVSFEYNTTKETSTTRQHNFNYQQQRNNQEADKTLEEKRIDRELQDIKERNEMTLEGLNVKYPYEQRVNETERRRD